MGVQGSTEHAQLAWERSSITQNKVLSAADSSLIGKLSEILRPVRCVLN